ncbi:MAG: anthranilate phosphoribosyltransferase [Cephaloticoccus sp.]|nr:anthranilate phosphoribosyltransferase [Cephaloticoccus sp.]MCF7761885.1 anthranilate phosphoribosyltransferase [Cephaloticoccus sp.]
MVLLSDLTAQISGGSHLQPLQVEAAAAALASPEVADDVKASFLTALAEKGETATEVAAFAESFRRRALDPGLSEWSTRAIDVVGTGGDHSGGFNISSLVVLTLASAGVPTMKHGNRGITSKCGSADLLAALGVDLMAAPAKLRHAMRDLGFVFFFAPNYHPAFKHIVPVRKALAAQGKRTVFNILGPLINPGRPAHVLLGSFSEIWAPRLAQALEVLGAKAGLAVHGVIEPGKGIDELTTATTNHVHGFGRLAKLNAIWRAEDLGLSTAPFTDLVGGDLETNLNIIEAVLSGKGPRGLVDTIVLNTAVALWITEHTVSIEAGLERARDLLLGGAVRRKIDATREFYRS